MRISMDIENLMRQEMVCNLVEMIGLWDHFIVMIKTHKKCNKNIRRNYLQNRRKEGMMRG